MGRLTVRFPQTLHNELVKLADQEGVSLNQYIIYALTRQAALSHGIQSVSQPSPAEQRAAFDALLQSLGQGSLDDIRAILSEREEIEPETGLTPDVIQHLPAWAR